MLVCAFVALVVVGITLRNAWLERQQDLAALAAEVEAAGYTLDPAVFESAYHAGKPDPNAADAYLEALALLSAGDGDGAVAKAMAAAEIPRSRFPLRFQQEASIPFDYSQIRDLSSAISERMAAALEINDRDSARSLLDAQFALAESLNEAPLLLMQAIRYHLLRLALDDLVGVFESGVVDATWLDAIDATLSAIDLQPALVDAMAAERTATFAGTVERAASRSAFGRAYDLVSGSQEALQRGSLRAYGELIAALESPPRYRPIELERIATLTASMPTYERMSAEAIVTAAVRIISVGVEIEGLLAAARGACVVERYRITHGNLPESESDLASIGWTLPDDPLGSGIIRYASNPEGGYRLWSVGRDGLDHGGQSSLDDVVFVVDGAS